MGYKHLYILWKLHLKIKYDKAVVKKKWLCVDRGNMDFRTLPDSIKIYT